MRFKMLVSRLKNDRGFMHIARDPCLIITLRGSIGLELTEIPPDVLDVKL